MSRKRIILLICLILLIPLGLATKSWHGPGEILVHNHLGGMFYAMFFTILPVTVFPELSTAGAAGSALLFCTGIEFLQKVHNPFLDSVRDTFLGAVLLGSDFSYADFIFYATGCLLGALLLIMVKRRERDTGVKSD
jgi:hypothetical protein